MNTCPHCQTRLCSVPIADLRKKFCPGCKCEFYLIAGELVAHIHSTECPTQQMIPVFLIGTLEGTQVRRVTDKVLLVCNPRNPAEVGFATDVEWEKAVPLEFVFEPELAVEKLLALGLEVRTRVTFSLKTNALEEGELHGQMPALR